MTGPVWTARDLIEATGGRLSRPFDAAGVSIDTRTLVPGDLFVALVGDGRDGHQFVADALNRGAAGVMVHNEVPADAAALRVDNTLGGLGRLGGFARARFGDASGRLVAVTGSVGKTTTKEMLRAALAAFGVTHAAVASYNNHWGVPLTLARIPTGARFCVAEIGMNHAGEIAPLSRMARPQVAVITTVAAAHIGHLGSIEAIADEKASIIAGLEPGGVAVLPGDSPHFPRLLNAAGGARVLTFGTNANADARLLHYESDADGSSLRVAVLGKVLTFRLNAPGGHMAMNAVCTLCAVAAVDLDPAVAIPALETFQPMAGRGARRAIAIGGGSALLLDESYNGNGASMRAALEVLRLQPVKRRVAVLGDMLELGADGPAEHAGLAADVLASVDLLFTCGPLMQGLFEAIPAALRGAHAADSRSLSQIVAARVADGDAILVKGSLGSRMKLVVDAIESTAAGAR